MALLKNYNTSESLIKHAFAGQGVMRYMAGKHGEDKDTWGVVGLIHDLDYEQFPDQHCKKTEEILVELDELITDTIMEMREVAFEIGLKGDD